MSERTDNELMAKFMGWRVNDGGLIHDDRHNAVRDPWNCLTDALLIVDKLGTWHAFDFLIRKQDGRDEWEAGWFEDGHGGYESRCSAFSMNLPSAIVSAILQVLTFEITCPHCRKETK